MYLAPHLLQVLVAMLATHGLAPEAMDPWRGWIAFKQFARSVDEVPDPGISVQLRGADESGSVRLAYVRQVVEPDGDRLEPVSGVVCEFTFPTPLHSDRTWEYCSFDYPTLEHFIDRVERHPDFADLMVRRPVRSAVYIEEA